MAQKIEFGLNIINHSLIAFITLYLSYICFKVNLYKTALHAWLCTIGFHLLMAEGIMCYYSGNVLTYTTSRNTKTTVHWILMALGGTLGIIGSIIKMVDKNNSNAVHFKTAHAIFGLLATILCALASIAGVSALYSQNLKFFITPVLVKTLHLLLGISGFFCAMLTMYYGYDTGFFRRKVSTDLANLMKVLTIISLILCMIGPFKSFYQKLIAISKG